MTIADYCSAFARREILINKRYQRSPDVWPLPARSYLIETILKGFPIPKLALHQVTDLKSKKTLKHVVDGQQRSSVILAFYNNELKLSSSLELAEARNLTYEELSDELQQEFLAYPLHFDQFEAASEEDVREYFRRINSFTAPLNPEEQRHARYQGPMKWFVYALTSRYGESLVSLGVLAERSVVRMADTKFLAEVVHALVYGVTTTNKRSLDSMYGKFDKGSGVQEGTQIQEAIDKAFDTIFAMQELRGTALMRMNVFYSLVLALILVQKSWPKLSSILAQASGKGVAGGSTANLLRLAAALEQPEVYEAYKEFTDAAAEKTNVKAEREKRVKWLARALTESNI